MPSPLDMPVSMLNTPGWIDQADDAELEAELCATMRSGRDMPIGELANAARYDRVRSILTRLVLQADDDLRDLKSEFNSVRSKCFTQGHFGKQRWFDFESGWRERHAPVASWKATIQSALMYLKANKDTSTTAAVTNRTAELQNALVRLAKAIAQHKEYIEFEGGESSVTDRALWAELVNIRIPSGRSATITLRELIDRLMEGGR